MAAKIRELNPAEEACAQHMALSVVAKLGSRLASKDVGVCPSLLWKWSRGRSSPTKAKFRDLQRVYEKNRVITKKVVFDKSSRLFYFEDDPTKKFKRLQDILDSITDASEEKQYIIELPTSEYTK